MPTVVEKVNGPLRRRNWANLWAKVENAKARNLREPKQIGPRFGSSSPHLEVVLCWMCTRWLRSRGSLLGSGEGGTMEQKVNEAKLVVFVIQGQ